MASSLATAQDIEGSSAWLDYFIEVYQKLNKDNLALLSDVYHSDITFVDPFHQIDGLAQLHDYFANLYENLNQCQFIINDTLLGDGQAAIYWKMVFSHKKLKGGKPISVDGHSILRVYQDKIIYHRDYFDSGAMIYEQLPVLSSIIGFIKRRMAQ